MVVVIQSSQRCTRNTQQSHKVTRERPGYWHQQCGPHPLGKTLLAISSGREPLACVSTWIREAPPPTRSRASEYERRCCTFGLRNTIFVSLPTSTWQAFQLPARVDAFLFFHCFVGVAFSLYWYKSQICAAGKIFCCFVSFQASSVAGLLSLLARISHPWYFFLYFLSFFCVFLFSEQVDKPPGTRLSSSFF